jgi:hypothetical protein
MMKLFMVLYILGTVQGSVGPLPYDEPECQRRVAEIRLECRNNPAVPYTCADVAMKCERHPSHPEIEPMP